MRTGIGFVGSALAILLTAVPAQAALLDGQTIKYQYLFPDQSSSIYQTSFTVDNTIELDGLYGTGTHATVDVSDTNILVDFYDPLGTWTSTSFNGFRIYHLDPFKSVTVNPATNMVGFDSTRITFDPNNIYINWQGLDFDSDTIVSLDVNATSVPEPTSLLLLGTGLVGAGLRRSRLKRA